MTHPQTAPLERTATNHDALRVLVLLVAILAVAAVATVVFGINHPGPSLDIFPDPGAALGF
jgi:hypothetical protein